MKDPFKAQARYYGDFAASNKSMGQYTKRYNKIKASYSDLDEGFGLFAGSDYELEEFVKRYFMIRDSNTGLKDCFSEFAVSGRPLY